MSELIDRRVSPRIFCDFSVDYQARGARAELGRISNIGTAGVEFGDLSIRAQDEMWRYYAKESARHGHLWPGNPSRLSG